MLLYKREITSVEIVNFISLLCRENIFVDDINDNMDDLFMCIDCYNYELFKIRNDLEYNSYLFKGVTVREFLYVKSNSDVLRFINEKKLFSELVDKVDYLGVVRKKKKKNLLGRVFNFM